MRVRYVIDRKSPFAWAACFFMLLCALFRLVYFVGRPMTPLVFWVHFLLPLLACVLFWAAVWIFGARCAPFSALSVLLGVVFFIVKALDFPSRIHTILCVLLYLLVLALYTLTVFGVIPTKVLLYPLFGLPLLVHIGMDIVEALSAEVALPFTEWLPELSVLCIMAGLLSLSAALKKQTRETL